jgi:hypothetical protein
MQLTSLSKSVQTIGLITLLSAIQGMSMVKTAQAQTDPNAEAVCTAAYFDNPGYMYQAATQQQQEAIDKFQKDPERMKRWDNMMAEITTFSAPLDSPMGYVINKVNGKEVPLPPEIEEEIKQAVYVDPSQNSRKRVAELNQKYGQYATFGQNINLILSPQQRQDRIKDTYEYIAYIKSVLTPQERQAQRDQATAAPLTDGFCSPSALFDPNNPETLRSLSIDTGIRPDLDKRLREDKTGATFFQ